MTKRKNKGTICAFVPDNLVFEEFIEKINGKYYSLRIKNPQAYKFYFLIFLIQDYLYKYQPKHGYAHLHSNILKYYVTDYAQYYHFLEMLDWIKVRQYQQGAITKRYKFTDKCSTILKEVTISKASIVSKYLNRPSSKKEQLSYPWLENYLPILDIREEEALLLLIEQKERGELNEKKYSYAEMAVSKIKNKSGYSVVDDSGFRLHTPLTSLNRSLRPFLHVGEQSLTHIDICNSQLFFSLLIFDKRFYDTSIADFNIDILKKGKDYYKYIHVSTIMSALSVVSLDLSLFRYLVTNGIIYEWFGCQMFQEKIVRVNDPIVLRERAKKALIRILFSKSEKYKTKAKDLFIRYFPSIWTVFAEFKRTNHKTLAILLQRIEAYAILSRAAKVFEVTHPEVPLFSIHDSLITTDEYADKLRQLMRKEIKSIVGFEPKLK